ncbi:MAG TPA: PQQ-binding-like beta-propeller repeat protein [Chthoniobacter sp.]|nr:PQQ-binding-like beta-propeller repeat protein [Chthoniobacter sp.]
MRFPRLPLFLLAAGLASLGQMARAEDWPGWRGLRGDGTSAEKQVPVQWDATKGEGVAWSTEIPGEGHSSPIVLGKRVFVTSAMPETEERLLLCLDRDSGKELWRRTVLTSPLERKHRENSYASSTPATDGKRVFVSFLEGNNAVLAAYDLEGKQQWVVQPGVFHSQHGFSSSPVIFEDKVIVNGDHDGDAWIAALSREDGHTIWKIDRENKTRSYCTPIIRDLAGRTQMILSGSKCVASYDPRNGQRHWIIDGPTEQFVASIVYNAKHDMLFMTGGFPAHHILGIKPDGQGNVTDSKIVWRTNKGVSYVPSPISEGDYFLVVSDGGVASCFHAATGEMYWQERVGPHAHSSIVSANGLVYFTADDGTTTVVKPGPTFEVVAKNVLGEPTESSPAISDGHVFLRGAKHLYCLGAKR